MNWTAVLVVRKEIASSIQTQCQWDKMERLGKKAGVFFIFFFFPLGKYNSRTLIIIKLSDS